MNSALDKLTLFVMISVVVLGFIIGNFCEFNNESNRGSPLKVGVVT